MTLHTILVSGVMKCITELPDLKPLVPVIAMYHDPIEYSLACADYDVKIAYYNMQLESAKNNAIPYEDQEKIQWLIVHNSPFREDDARPFEFKEGQIYSFDYQGRTKTVDVPEEDSGIDASGPPYAKVDFKKVIRLIPEVEGSQEDEMSSRVARLLLKIRDEIARVNISEAYHALYEIASPDFDKTEPWENIERIASKTP
jgi:hypothetical protein